MKTTFLMVIGVSAWALLSGGASGETPAAGHGTAVPVAQQSPPAGEQPAPSPATATVAAEKLNMLWTSQDKEVALKMVFMYANAAKKQGWWKEVHVIIWGPSARLTATDKDVQDALKRLRDAGVTVLACRACADQYGVSKVLEGLGVEVKYMGQPLTEILKRGEKLVTF